MLGWCQKSSQRFARLIMRVLRTASARSGASQLQAHLTGDAVKRLHGPGTDLHPALSVGRVVHSASILGYVLQEC
jgi:hypothetical protein